MFLQQLKYIVYRSGEFVKIYFTCLSLILVLLPENFFNFLHPKMFKFSKLELQTIEIIYN